MQNNNEGLFGLFLKSEDTLWISSENDVIFQSRKKGIEPLIDYINQHSPCINEVIVCDRVVGNAAALLLKVACCKMLYASIGSEIAVETLNRLGIPCRFLKMVPYIINRKGDGMCPFEKASIGKSPDEFLEYQTKSNSLNSFTPG
ncbi:MAG: hypothetical protein B1H13_12345 [Desulfobacteraceae bacterium 4484_190.3]|nr:MAG: hypothetical protein B1H13_12345 [Desulfobacteraceae bacterium 4484_190.3]